MGIPINIPGLNQFIKEVPEGTMISVQGGVDPPKAVLVSVIASTAKEIGWNINYACPRGRCGSLRDLPGLWRDGIEIVEGNAPTIWKDAVRAKSLLIIDSISYLMQGCSLSEFKLLMEEIMTVSRNTGAVVINLVEMGMLDEKEELLTGFYADGIVQFLCKDTGEGLSRFIRISKWMAGSSYDRNIYYTYEEGRINIDLRYRVV